MKKLREQFALMSALAQTASALATEEKKAAQEIEEAVKHGDYTSDAQMQKLSQAQLRKTLIPARRKKLAAQIAEAEVGLLAAYSDARRAWDSFVAARKAEVFERLLGVLEPFFGGPGKAEQTRREFEHMHVPARDALNRAFSPDFSKADATFEDHVQWAECLFAHAARYSKEFGWGDPEKIKAPTKAPEARKSAAPQTVRVRARETVTLPSLFPPYDVLSSPTGKMKPTHVIKAGEELELDAEQYGALSRHFDRI